VLFVGSGIQGTGIGVTLLGSKSHSSSPSQQRPQFEGRQNVSAIKMGQTSRGRGGLDGGGQGPWSRAVLKNGFKKKVKEFLS